MIIFNARCPHTGVDTDDDDDDDSAMYSNYNTNTITVITKTIIAQSMSPTKVLQGPPLAPGPRPAPGLISAQII